MSKLFILTAFALGLALAAGCSDKLETGYAPQHLDMSLAQRRALYSVPYSQEANDAGKEPAQASEYHRPTAAP
jgi:hypothetical protein